MADLITDVMEDNFSVTEMIGVAKYLELTNVRHCRDYLEELREWESDGFGESTVKSCRETLQ